MVGVHQVTGTICAMGDVADDAKTKVAKVAPRFADGVESQPFRDCLMGTGLTTDNLCITLQIKEVEARSKQLGVQTMHLCIRALELEKKAPAAYICFCYYFVVLQCF